MTRYKVSDKAVVRAAVRQDLGAFVMKVFQTLHPGNEYRHSWHVDAMTHALVQVYRGIIRRLNVNVPPRHLKSVCASIAFVAWALGHNPSLKFACVSYSEKLATDLARQFRKVITSDWYRALFPNVQLCKDTETECETTKGGGRFVVPVGGSFTGRGADFIIIDDVINAKDAQSDKLRHAANEWYRESIIARLDDKAKGAIILVAQRLHEDDLCGQVLRKGGWSHLNLPAIAEEDQEIPIGPGVVHHRKTGEALHPEREPLPVLEEIKREMGSIAFSAQYQQRPVPPEGNIIKRDWIRWYQTLPIRTPDSQVVQSWDLASTTADTSDWSVCTTWLMQKRTYYLLDVWRGRLQFPYLRRKVIALAREHKANRILIENAGPGLYLLQDLRRNPEAGVPILGISQMTARSCEWKPKPLGSRTVRFICPGRHHGSPKACTNFSDSHSQDTMIWSIAFRSFSGGPKRIAVGTTLQQFIWDYLLWADQIAVVKLPVLRDLNRCSRVKIPCSCYQGIR